MTDEPNAARAAKPASRASKFILIALVLVAALLWARREQARAQYEAEQAEYEEKLAAYLAEQQLSAAAFALAAKASASKDPDEQERLYDEIIAAYGDGEPLGLQRCVSWALWKKGQAAKDKAEKTKLFETAVDKYCGVKDSQVHRYVMASLNGILKLFDSKARKTAYCDEILQKYGSRLSDSIAARLLNEKARAARNGEEKIELYDAMLSRFLSSTEDGAFDLAVAAALGKMGLISDVAEQFRLCDIVIDAFLKTPQRTRHTLFRDAVNKKAELAGDPSLPLALWNQVIANNVAETAVAQASLERLNYFESNDERLAACDEFIDAHQDSTSNFMQYMVLRVMNRKAIFLPKSDERTALLRSVIEKGGKVKGPRVRSEINFAVGQLPKDDENTAFAIQYYDGIIAKTKNRRRVLRAMQGKVHWIKDPAEKIRAYDAILAMTEGDRDGRAAQGALFEKARLTENRDEKIRLYDEIIETCEQYLNTGKNRDETPGRRDWKRNMMLDNLGNAVLGRADLSEDAGEKAALYDKYLAFPESRRPDPTNTSLEKILAKKAGLAGESPLKAEK